MFASKAEERRFERATNIPAELVAEAVDLIINTRDFCGNEFEAVMELAAEHNLDKTAARKLYQIANFRANAKWNEFQKAAGVPAKYTF
jgi:hypothetical protein